jgi:hypothetical protein
MTPPGCGEAQVTPLCECGVEASPNGFNFVRRRRRVRPGSATITFPGRRAESPASGADIA